MVNPGRLVLAACALALLAPATSLAAEPDDRWKVPQCVAVGVGATFLEPLDHDDRFPDSVAGPAVDASYGYCGPFVEASLRLRFVDTRDLFMLQPGVQVRLHTRTPAGRGPEAGVALRVGYDYLNVTTTGDAYPGSEPAVPMWRPFDAFGIAASAGADVRYWLDERWGLLVAADAGWALAGQAYQQYGTDELAVGSLTITAGGALRF